MQKNKQNLQATSRKQEHKVFQHNHVPAASGLSVLIQKIEKIVKLTRNKRLKTI